MDCNLVPKEINNQVLHALGVLSQDNTGGIFVDTAKIINLINQQSADFAAVPNLEAMVLQSLHNLSALGIIDNLMDTHYAVKTMVASIDSGLISEATTTANDAQIKANANATSLNQNENSDSVLDLNKVDSLPAMAAHIPKELYYDLFGTSRKMARKSTSEKKEKVTPADNKTSFTESCQATCNQLSRERMSYHCDACKYKNFIDDELPCTSKQAAKDLPRLLQQRKRMERASTLNENFDGDPNYRQDRH